MIHIAAKLARIILKLFHGLASMNPAHMITLSFKFCVSSVFKNQIV